MSIIRYFKAHRMDLCDSKISGPRDVNKRYNGENFIFKITESAVQWT